MRFSQTSLLLLLGIIAPVFALPQDPVKNPADSTRYQEGFDPNAPTVHGANGPVRGDLSAQQLMDLTAQKAAVVHNKIAQEAQTVPLDAHVQSQVNKGKISEEAARQEKAKNFIDKTTPGMHGSLNVGGDTVFSTSNPKKKGGAAVPFAPHSQLTNDIMDKAKSDYKTRVQGMTDAEIAAHPEAEKLRMDKAHFAAGGDVNHKSGGRCSEQGCTDAFAASHPGTTMAQFNAIPDKKSASFGKTGASTTDQPSAACQGKNAGEIGCREFLQASNTLDCAPVLNGRSVHFKRAPACAYKPKTAANKAAAAAKAKTPAVNIPASKQAKSAKQPLALGAQKPAGNQKTLGGAVKPAANRQFATPNKAKSQTPLNNKPAPQVKGTTRKAAPAPKANSALPAGKAAFKQGPVSKAAAGLKKPLTQQKAATPAKAGTQPKAAGLKKPLAQAKAATPQRLMTQKAATSKFAAQKAAPPQKAAAGLKRPLNQQKAVTPKTAAAGPIRAAVPVKAKTATPVKAAAPIRAAAPVKQQKAAAPLKAAAPVKQVAPQKAAVKAATPFKAAAPVKAAAPAPVRAAPVAVKAAPAPFKAAPAPFRAPAPMMKAPAPFMKAPSFFTKKKGKRSSGDSRRRSSGDSRRSVEDIIERSSGDCV